MPSGDWLHVLDGTLAARVRATTYSVERIYKVLYVDMLKRGFVF